MEDADFTYLQVILDREKGLGYIDFIREEGTNQK